MAQGDGLRCIRNAAYRLTFGIKTTAGVLTTGLAGTCDSNGSVDGATPSDLTGEVAELGTTGVYTLNITAAEMTGDEVYINTICSGYPTIEHILNMEPALDSGVAQAGSASTITLRAAAVAVADYYNGAIVEIVRGTGAGQARVITDYSVGGACTVDRDWQTGYEPDTTSVYIIHPQQGVKLGTDIIAHANVQKIVDESTAATNLEAFYQGGLVVAAVSDALPGDDSFDTTLESTTDDFWNGSVLAFTSGDLKGLARKILDYDGTDKTITLSAAFPAAPANSDEFVVLARIE